MTDVVQTQRSRKHVHSVYSGLLLSALCAPAAYALDATDDVVSFAEPLGAGCFVSRVGDQAFEDAEIIVEGPAIGAGLIRAVGGAVWSGGVIASDPALTDAEVADCLGISVTDFSSISQTGPDAASYAEEDFISLLFTIAPGVTTNSAAFVGGGTYEFIVGRRPVAASADDTEETNVLTDDLLRTTSILSQSVSSISRNAANRLHAPQAQVCGQRINELLQDSPVQFASDSAVIGSGSTDVLNEIAALLGACGGARFRIEGHTDADGSDAYNLGLSQRRVDAVRAALAQRGIATDRLQAQGFGEQRPVASNATEAGKAQNRRVTFVLLDAGEPVAPSCDAGGAPTGAVNGASNALTGNIATEGYNCATGVRSETWGDLTVTHDDGRGTTGVVTFGMSRERQAQGVLNGRFVEGYVSRNEVEMDTADGMITGFGVHGGLYRSQAIDGGLIFSAYGSAAVGRHQFDLDVGTEVDGHYTYAGVFAGASIGGQTAAGGIILKPTAGVDLAYAEAIGTEVSVSDTLEVDPAKTARAFVELGVEQQFDTGTLTIAPRLFCENDRENDAEACGYGAGLSYVTGTDMPGVKWDVGVDYEELDTTRKATLSASRSQEVFEGLGVSRSSFGASAEGALQVEQAIKFSW